MIVCKNHQFSQLSESFDVILGSRWLQGGGEDEDCQDQLQHPVRSGPQLISKGLDIS